MKKEIRIMTDEHQKAKDRHFLYVRMTETAKRPATSGVRRLDGSRRRTERQGTSSRSDSLDGDLEARKSQGFCADVFAVNERAVVCIWVPSQNLWGTGIIVADGVLLTASHITYDEDSCDFYEDMYMTFYDDPHRYKVIGFKENKYHDVALCYFNPNKVVGGFSAVKLISDYSKLDIGADCCMIGNAVGMGLAPVRGIVRQTVGANGKLVFDKSMNPGDSGAPVFNDKGECIGLAQHKMINYKGISIEGMSYALNACELKKLLSRWCDMDDHTYGE